MNEKILYKNLKNFQEVLKHKETKHMTFTKLEINILDLCEELYTEYECEVK